MALILSGFSSDPYNQFFYKSLYGLKYIHTYRKTSLECRRFFLSTFLGENKIEKKIQKKIPEEHFFSSRKFQKTCKTFFFQNLKYIPNFEKITYGLKKNLKSKISKTCQIFFLICNIYQISKKYARPSL